MKHSPFFVFIFFTFTVTAQLTDHFDDGECTSNPSWEGTISDYIVNTAGQLQTNPAIAGTSYLSVANGLTNLASKEWRLWVKMSFSPSAGNYSKIYIVSANSDVSIDPDGFYLQLGETGAQDAVRLFKRQNGVSTEICAGISGQIANSFAIGIRVVRDSMGIWSLYVDAGGGENFTNPSTGYDNTEINCTSMGIICTYTVSNATKFYFDNFYSGDEIVDTNPPVLLGITPVYGNQIDVLFDESVELLSAQTISHYSFTPAIDIAFAAIDITNPALIHLSLSGELTNGTTYSATTSLIADISGNVSQNQTVGFTYMIAENAESGDVIINEFMCDPTPSVGLPEADFIEIYNKSNKYFNLHGWKIGDASASGIIQDTWLYPGEYLILCATSSFMNYPDGTGVTSFPSLNNSGDEIHLLNDQGVIIDELSYTDEWYSDNQKKEGGYTLERMKQSLECSGSSNWKASNSSTGGTPGVVNSINDTTPDTVAPKVLSIQTISNNSIQIRFNEGMDSSSLSSASITIFPMLLLQNILINKPYPDQMELQFAENMTGSIEYFITLGSLSDCSMNSADLTGVFALAESPVPGDLIINEILFDPLTGGSDFVEIFNRSEKLIDLYNWSFANFDSDTIANYATIQNHYLIRAHDYLAVTEDTLFVKQQYPFSAPGKFIESDLPNYNNDSGSVFLIYEDVVMDFVSYSKDWQFKLVDDPKGKSLERIDAGGLSNSMNNWHTAAESIGFGTPGRENSQDFKNSSAGDFDFTSKTISPDNDGFEDLLHVHYKMENPGMIGSFTIYDDKGRIIKSVFKSELLATEGTFTWDGISENSTRAIIGTYIGVFESFDIQTGEKFNKTKAFVVAGKL